LIEVREEGGQIAAEVKDRRYLFPRDDVVLVPIENTTAELLATHLAKRFREELEKLGERSLTALEIEVEESTGQSAIYRESLAAG
jgi:6-pyruvoyltetrahydropterin/6-carboxytetrahydropterin synthase